VTLLITWISVGIVGASRLNDFSSNQINVLDRAALVVFTASFFLTAFACLFRDLSFLESNKGSKGVAFFKSLLRRSAFDLTIWAFNTYLALLLVSMVAGNQAGFKYTSLGAVTAAILHLIACRTKKWLNSAMTIWTGSTVAAVASFAVAYYAAGKL
jgi:hypothetical protein